ncbi:MAG: alpha/beta fold hydrolase [Chitinophagaceae bacterium]
MEQLRLLYKNSFIGYCRFGKGAKPAICFHGYGENASTYFFLDKYAGHQYTFYSIDLPFHGLTEWKDGYTFSQYDLYQIITEILKTNNFLPQTTAIKLTLIGFSLGGRAALCICQAMPEAIEKIILLAPDGLKVNFWYLLATRTWAGNKFFHFTMKHPGWFFGFLKMLNKLKLVNARIFKFVNHYIGNAVVRQQLYDRWTTLRKLKPAIKRIKSCLKKNEIQVHLIYGKHDRIILSTVGERFRKGIEDNCMLSVIHSGHQVLHEKHVDEILPALLYGD